MRFRLATPLVLLGCCLSSLCRETPTLAAGMAEARSPYVWSTAPAGDTAQLVTLTCHACYHSSTEDLDVPLLAVLKDTLLDSDPENDRLTAVWLLGHAPPTFRQRVLSAVPFFYWRVGGGRRKKANLTPELDLTALQHPMMNTLGKDALQWLMLDGSGMPIRATSRAYRSNEQDHERLALEESITYLRAASASVDTGALSSAEISTLIARLELRKTLLGGFVTQRGAAEFADEDAAAHERVRSRNWELLRQCADKTGLYFEPLELAGSSGEYAVLWAPAEGLVNTNNYRLGPIWKLLNVRQPSQAELQRLAATAAYTRSVDQDGSLRPLGDMEGRQIKLVPLSAYSLNYPKMPLLLVDFRNGQHLRWHAMTQRSINEVTAGIIGISHFTNWYYYVAADAYDFIASRHGAALNQSERLDCYSQFRVALALDHQLEPRLRMQMSQNVNSLAMNPLEVSPAQEISTAAVRFQALQAAAAEGKLEELIDKDRRAELISYSTSSKRAVFDSFLHLASFGTYTRRAPSDERELVVLDTLRRTQAQLRFLDGAAAQGTRPEVAIEAARIQDSLAELRSLLPRVTSPQMRAHAAETIGRIQNLSQDQGLRSDCSVALNSLRLEALTHSSGVALQTAGAVRGNAHVKTAEARP